MFRKIRELVLASFQPFIIPMSLSRMTSTNGKVYAPLTKNGTALLSLDATPHSTSFDKILGSSVDCVQIFLSMFTPVWNKPPLHSV